MRHPVEMLFAELTSVQPFPTGVVVVPERIPGTAFFPGGAGLWATAPGRPWPSMPTEGVMVLGHDFHSLNAFKETLARGGEVVIGADGEPQSHVPSWTNLLGMLKEFGIPPERCFFTNAYMGLRDANLATGKFPGARDATFVERCRTFLELQLRAQRPRLILTLGQWVPSFLAPLAERLSDWKSLTSLNAIDRAGPVRHEVRFNGNDMAPCSVVCLTHPSFRPLNVKKREYGGSKGGDAEHKMVIDAICQSGVTLP